MNVLLSFARIFSIVPEYIVFSSPSPTNVLCQTGKKRHKRKNSSKDMQCAGYKIKYVLHSAILRMDVRP